MYNATKLEYFKNRYNNDADFRKKQLDYLKSKIVCSDCGKTISRSNITKHKNRKWHRQLIAERQTQMEIDKLKSVIEELRKSTTNEQYENILINV